MSHEGLNRRAFLSALGYGVTRACLLGKRATWAQAAAVATPATSKPTRRVDHFEAFPDGSVACGVCPHACVLHDGEVGRCRARINRGGVHYALGYGNPCIVQVDPIEKLPINHFRPGRGMLTISCGGCNLGCLYCQNWQQAQERPDQLKTFELSPREAVAAARKHKLDIIGFTYTEPIAFLEYARDIAVQAKETGIKIVVGTSAFVHPEPLLELARYADAFAITLKGFDDGFYQEVCGARLDPVLTAIKTLHERTRCWLEIINLVVPTYNDRMEDVSALARWVHAELGKDVPLHFARFVPLYKLTDLPRTAVPTLESACAVAREAGLRHVYTSNIAPHRDTNTYCDGCKTVVVERLGFKILSNNLRHGRCPICRRPIPGVWA